MSGTPAVRPRGRPSRRGTPRFILRIEGQGRSIRLRSPLLPVAMLVACTELVLYPVLQIAVPFIAERHGDEEVARVLRELPAFPLSRIMGELMRGGVPLEVSVCSGERVFHLRLG
jgi:hypothetical protein